VVSGACHVQVCRPILAAHAAPGFAQETKDAVLHATGPGLGEHALVIGHDTPGIVMDLACRGAAEITLLGPKERPEAATVDVAVVTSVARVGCAQRTVAAEADRLPRCHHCSGNTEKLRTYPVSGGGHADVATGNYVRGRRARDDAGRTRPAGQ